MKIELIPHPVYGNFTQPRLRVSWIGGPDVQHVEMHTDLPDRVSDDPFVIASLFRKLAAQIEAHGAKTFK